MSLLRWLYAGLVTLLLPLLLLRLWLRQQSQPGYAERWWQRFGVLAARDDAPLCIHAVSVGEVRAIVPLIKRLQQQKPEWPVVVTTMTATGAQQLRELMGDAVTHVWLPYDAPWCVAAFLRALQPRAFWFVETEVWPNLLSACARRGIPTALINARLSPKSLHSYQRLTWLMRPALGHLTHLLARTSEDADRFRVLLGDSPALETVGDIKFDLELSPERVALPRPVWIAASTHEGEDELLLDAHRSLLAQHPQALLILVPRHPERFERVGQLVDASGLSWARRSVAGEPPEDVSVFLIDCLGELVHWYRYAQLAFVAGSLVERGGHNPIEPAALGLPILSGEHVNNFASAYADLQRRQAARLLDASALASALDDLLKDEAQRAYMGSAAQQWYAENRGATERVLAVLLTDLSEERKPL